MSHAPVESSPVPAVARRSRPAWLRALGPDDPPATVTIDGTTYAREEIFKHDSWAATALYAAGEQRVVCKFNRKQSLLGLPGAWIGRFLARREADFLRRLTDVPYVPRLLGAVIVDGRPAANAVARRFIAGHPLRKHERVHDDFFPQLAAALDAVHRCDVAYVDLHKRENVIVGDDGRPYLIDFQVSFGVPAGGGGLLRFVLRRLQRMDAYHRDKLFRKSRPDLCGLTSAELNASRPWFIRLHRLVAVPFRYVRRKLLILLGVRASGGRVESERFVEAGLRRAA
jgi:hypothetical protein